MAADYYSAIARAVSGLPSKTDEARRAVYERARTALQERLRTHDPPISKTDLAIEEFALEAAIQRVETESRFSDTGRGAREEASLSTPSLRFISTLKQFVRSARDKLNHNVRIRRDGLMPSETTVARPPARSDELATSGGDQMAKFKHQVRSAIVGLTPPLVLGPIEKLWRRARGLRGYDFKGSWPTFAEVPATRDNVDHWAQTVAADWQDFDSPALPTIDNTGKLILPLLVSQFDGPVTVLDFGGGYGNGLMNIRRYARNLDLSHLTYVLVETPAMCLAVRSKIEAHAGTVTEQIPDALGHPLIIHAASSLHYIEDYRDALARLLRLAPQMFIVTRTPMTDGHTYARQLYSVPHRVIPTWVFNRADFIAEVKSQGYRLCFSVDHDLPLTHKDAPGPWVTTSMVFLNRGLVVFA